MDEAARTQIRGLRRSCRETAGARDVGLDLDRRPSNLRNDTPRIR